MKESCTFSEFMRLARLRESTGELSAIRQLLELLILMPFHKVGPGFYQMAGFWRKGVPWAHKKGHLSAASYRSTVDRLNPAAYRKLSQNKLSETAILRLFHIPSPEYLGYFDTTAGQDAQGRPLRSAEDLIGFVQALEVGQKVCFKPLEGWAGEGFEIAEIREAGAIPQLYRLKNQSLLDVAQFKEQVIDGQHQGSSMIEAFLEQDPALAAFNPSSVNTIRLWAAREVGGETRALLAYLRIGRAGSLVDNQSSGGIVAPIDLNSGRLSAAIDGLYHHNVFPRHPDHDAAIEGETVPRFEECVELAKTALAAFPQVRFAGMDIALARKGPQIIEMNLSPDREGAAFVGVPTSAILSTAALG